MEQFVGMSKTGSIKEAAERIKKSSVFNTV